MKIAMCNKLGFKFVNLETGLLVLYIYVLCAILCYLLLYQVYFNYP